MKMYSNLRLYVVMCLTLGSAYLHGMEQEEAPTNQISSEQINVSGDFLTKWREASKKLKTIANTFVGAQAFFCVEGYEKSLNDLAEEIEKATPRHGIRDAIIRINQKDLERLQALVEERTDRVSSIYNSGGVSTEHVKFATYNDAQMLAYIYSPDRGYDLPARLEVAYQSFISIREYEKTFTGLLLHISMLANTTRKYVINNRDAIAAEAKKTLQQEQREIEKLGVAHEWLDEYNKEIKRFLEKDNWLISDYISLTKMYYARKSTAHTIIKNSSSCASPKDDLPQTKPESGIIMQLMGNKLPITASLIVAGLGVAWWYFFSSSQQQNADDCSIQTQ